ncbi:hypothetical protein [Flavobacterium oreochromis]|uniref:YD repeat-containing protein n=1 Tax=Flavobacterium oreochromis TaxID=2906078 RepID=A0ABW8P890_9FLAO|nr:hypothetical protein [Flavobacterium oreochromis]OWP78530.1 hypothetical protein BWG23_01845 [Flavobacterium oreochromis]
MKKMNLIVALFLTLLSLSCSKDKDDTALDSNSGGLKRPKRMIYTNPSGSSQTLSFFYEGNNLKKITVNTLSNVPEYFYQNGVLTEFKELASSSKKFYYDNSGKLNKIISISGDTYFGADFIYNNGSSKINSAKFYRSPGSLWKELSYEYDANGNVVKLTNLTTNTYLKRTYDTKNNPFINVNCQFENHNLVKNDWFQPNKNNCLTASGEASTGQIGSSKFTYTYDADNFPIKRVETRGNTLYETIVYEY